MWFALKDVQDPRVLLVKLESTGLDYRLSQLVPLSEAPSLMVIIHCLANYGNTLILPKLNLAQMVVSSGPLPGAKHYNEVMGSVKRVEQWVRDTR